MESPASFDWNWSRLSELMATSGRLFHIHETSGKKECLADRVRVYGTRNLSPSPLVLVFRCVSWSLIGMSTTRHKAAPHAKHHGGAGFPSPFAQGVPAEGAKHCSDATLPGVIVADKASIPALGALKLVCVEFGVWVPECRGGL